MQVLQKIRWNDPSAIFRKPALCLIGPQNKTFAELPKELTICIAAKYKAIAKQYLSQFEKQGYKFRKKYVNGCVETSCSEGIADVIIDIVYSGSSLKKYVLEIYGKIIESDFVIIGGGKK